MPVLLTAANFPLYFTAAWLAGNRKLSDGLKYRLPLSLRAECPVIRRFWAYDLLFSSMALPFAIVSSHAISKFLFSDQTASFGAWVYPLSFLLLGLIWPEATRFSLVVNKDAGGAVEISVGAIRDRFLGGSFTDEMNSNLDAAVQSYIDRVLAAMTASPKLFEKYLQRRLPGVVPADLRAKLIDLARADFGSLYNGINEITMIPFVERPKPLMRIPGITFQEEVVLHDAGVDSVRALSRSQGSAVGPIAAGRILELRTGAREVIGQRRRLLLAYCGIAVCFTALGTVSTAVFRSPAMVAGSPVRTSK